MLAEGHSVQHQDNRLQGAETEAFFSRWLAAFYCHQCKLKGTASSWGVNTGKRQQQPHGYPAFTSHPSQITKHITNHCLAGNTSLSPASFHPSLVNPSSVILVKLSFFCHAQRSAAVCISRCCAAETPLAAGCEHQATGDSANALVPAAQGGTGQ